MPNSLGAIVRIEPDKVRKSPEILPERSFTSFIQQAFIEDLCVLSTPRHLVLLSPALHTKACSLFHHSCNVLTKDSNCHGPFYSRGFWSKENIYWRNRVSYVISPFKIICYFKRSVFLKSPSNGLSFQGMQRRLCSWPQEVLMAEVLTQKASLRGTGEPSWSWGEVLTLQWIDWFMNYPRSSFRTGLSIIWPCLWVGGWGGALSAWYTFRMLKCQPTPKYLLYQAHY